MASERRTVILDAAITVIAAHGLTGLTHRAVDVRAGLPLGSSSYYFPRRAALLEGTTTRLAERLERESEALRLSFADLVASGRRDEALDLVSGALAACAEDERALLLARVELALAAARDPALREVSKHLTVAAKRPVRFFLTLLAERAGQSDAVVETCLGMIDGMLLLHATEQGPAPSNALIRTICAALLAERGDMT